jgi:hypothetical protein
MERAGKRIRWSEDDGFWALDENVEVRNSFGDLKTEVQNYCGELERSQLRMKEAVTLSLVLHAHALHCTSSPVATWI